MRTSLGALVIGAVLATGAVACGSGSDDGGKAGADTELSRVLKSVPASHADESVLFRDVSVARRLVDANRELYSGLHGYAVPELNEFGASNLQAEYGFDEKDITLSLLVGNSPTSLITGKFSPDAISKAMREQHGYTAAETDGGVHLTKSDSPTIDASDSVRIKRTSDSAPDLALTQPAESVIDDTAYRAVLDCLGNVYAATLYGKGTGHNPDVVLLGIGARLGDQDSSSETLCAVAKSRDAAETTAKALRDQETAPGKKYEGSEVTVGNGETPVVSMTWQNKPDNGLRPGEADKYWELPNLMLKLRP